MCNKVLILAYDFPPYVSVGGIRPYNWYKFFSRFNIYPVVITRQWSNVYGDQRDYIAPGYSKKVEVEISPTGTIVRTPYSPNLANRILLKYGSEKFGFIRRCISAIYEFGQFVLPIGTKYRIYKEARNYLRNNKVDVIIATVDPFILFRYASRLSREFNIPWIADYRDPWSVDPTKSKNKWWLRWDSYWEKKTVSTAYCAVTVSTYVRNIILSVVKSQKCYIIPNGYDPDSVDAAALVEQNRDKLSIGYAGSIPNWSPLESFLSVCNEFVKIKKEPKFAINFFGTDKGPEIIRIISELYPDLEKYVNIFPKVPNDQFLKQLAQQNVFLLFSSFSIMGTKIYDYIGLKRKILFCFSDDPESMELKKKYFHINDHFSDGANLQEELLNTTNSGMIVKSKDHLLKALEVLYDEFESNGKIGCDSVKPESLSRAEQTAVLANIIKESISKKKLVPCQEES